MQQPIYSEKVGFLRAMFSFAAVVKLVKVAGVIAGVLLSMKVFALFFVTGACDPDKLQPVTLCRHFKSGRQGRPFMKNFRNVLPVNPLNFNSSINTL